MKLLEFFMLLYNMVSSAIWKKHARVSFSKKTKIARVRRTSFHWKCTKSRQKVKNYIANTCRHVNFFCLFPGSALVLLICTVIIFALQCKLQNNCTPFSQSEFMYIIIYIIYRETFEHLHHNLPQIVTLRLFVQKRNMLKTVQLRRTLTSTFHQSTSKKTGNVFACHELMRTFR